MDQSNYKNKPKVARPQIISNLLAISITVEVIHPQINYIMKSSSAPGQDCCTAATAHPGCVQRLPTTDRRTYPCRQQGGVSVGRSTFHRSKSDAPWQLAREEELEVDFSGHEQDRCRGTGRRVTPRWPIHVGFTSIRRKSDGRAASNGRRGLTLSGRGPRDASAATDSNQLIRLIGMIARRAAADVHLAQLGLENH